MASDIDFMKIALKEAEIALNKGEIPVGAVIVINSSIISKSHNKKESSLDPTAHAETLAIREAALKIGNWRLNGATLYVTKEPCVMCAGAILNSRISRLVFGCGDAKGGAAISLYQLLSDNRLNHQAEVISGVLENESRELLKRFFGDLRK
jgi:tRNA(adenine34) deaminase